jgi:hypothetical protein
MEEHFVPEFVIDFFKHCKDLIENNICYLHESIEIVLPTEFIKQDTKISRPLITRYLGMGNYLVVAMLPINYVVENTIVGEEIFFVARCGGSNCYDQDDSYQYFAKQTYDNLLNEGKLFNFETALKLLMKFNNFSDIDYKRNYVDCY